MKSQEVLAETHSSKPSILGKRRQLFHATDGSQAARDAFKILLEDVYEKGDHVTVFHLTDCRKVYHDVGFVRDFAPESILEDYKMIMTTKIPKNSYDIIFEEVDQKLSNHKKQIAIAASKLNSSYVVLGAIGRKGEKEDKYVVGKTCMEIAHSSKIPVFIIKRKYQREKNPTKGFNIACCVDGSTKSLKTLQIAKDLAKNKNDRIYVLTVDEEGPFPVYRDPVRDKVTAECARINIKAEHIFIEENGEASNSLTTFINENDKVSIDIAVLGTNGARAETTQGYFVGRMMTKIVNSCLVNPVIIP